MSNIFIFAFLNLLGFINNGKIDVDILVWIFSGYSRSAIKSVPKAKSVVDEVLDLT